MIKTKRKVFELELVNVKLISKISDKNINEIEKIVGNDDVGIGSKIMKDFLSNLVNSGLSAFSVGKMIGKDRHVLHRWYKRYNIKIPKYEGFKKAILKTTQEKKRHEVVYGCYKKINGSQYRIYYVYPNTVFSYMLGLILGDGYADDRKLYITGGKPYDFLDAIYPIAKRLGRYLGDRKVKTKYFDKNDKETKREDPNTSYWRIYIYWSAFSHLIRNKEVLKETLFNIFKTRELFDSFTAGFFDADGYFVTRNKKPERIGIQQSKTKWWFPLFYSELKERYSTVINERTRNYKIKNRGKAYRGINESYVVRLKQSSWEEFINSIMPYSKKPMYHKRAEWFKSYALKGKSWWR